MIVRVILLGLVVLAFLGGCKGRDESKEKGAPAVVGDEARSKSLILSPRIDMKVDEGGLPVPVLHLDSTDGEGKKQSIELSPEALKNPGAHIQLSVGFGTPVPEGASEEPVEAAGAK